MIVIALDYKGTGCPLTCSVDSKNMQELARQCGIEDLTVLDDCTKESACAAIREIGQRCRSEDFLVFYYAGHGMSLSDRGGDEKDIHDEAFCFVDDNGKIGANTILADDEFADLVCSCTEESARILILTDCCHSGTIADLRRSCWGTRQVISITGCLDNQTAGDTGKGGIFTHSMLLAVENLRSTCASGHSVGMLYNTCLDQNTRVFHSSQDITLQSSPAVSPDTMAWPIAPTRNYQAPLTQAVLARSAANVPCVKGTGRGEFLDSNLLPPLGIKPELFPLINVAGLLEGYALPEFTEKSCPGVVCQPDICNMM